LPARLREVIIEATHPSYSPAEHRLAVLSGLHVQVSPHSQALAAAFKRWEVADGAPRNCRPPTFPVLRPGVLRWRDVRNPHDTLVFHPSPPLPFTPPRSPRCSDLARDASDRCLHTPYPSSQQQDACRCTTEATELRGMSPIPTLPHPAYRAHVPRPARWAGSPPGWQHPQGSS
jgi:hypothetical protein